MYIICSICWGCGLWIRRKASLNFSWLEDLHKWMRTYFFVIAFHVPHLAGETIILKVHTYCRYKYSYEVIVLFDITVPIYSTGPGWHQQNCVCESQSDCKAGDGDSSMERKKKCSLLLGWSASFPKDVLRFTGFSKEKLCLSSIWVLNSHGTSLQWVHKRWSGCLSSVLQEETNTFFIMLK